MCMCEAACAELAGQQVVIEKLMSLCSGANNDDEVQVIKCVCVYRHAYGYIYIYLYI